MTDRPRRSNQHCQPPIETHSAFTVPVDAASNGVSLTSIERRKVERSQQFAVSTWLMLSERDSVDAAGFGTYTALHRESMVDVIADLRANRASAAIVSAARVANRSEPLISTVVRGFTGIPVLGLVLHVDDDLIEGARVLGELGVTRVVDGRRCSGWNQLRVYLDSSVIVDPARRAAILAIDTELGDATTGCKRFLLETFEPTAARANELAARLHLVPSTLMSRFQRAKLPSPKQYLRYARLVRAAFLGEAHGRSCSDIANLVNASSPQSFGRSVRHLMGMTPVQFRYTFKGDAMLRVYVREMITPHRNILRTFDPTMTTVHCRSANQCGSQPRY